MRKLLFAAIALMLTTSGPMQAAPKKHVIAFGKPMMVKLFFDHEDRPAVDLKVRPLYIDGALKEFTTGEAHDLTEQQFAVQRAFRVNDSLPGDGHAIPKWRWQRGAWLLVDRNSGRISTLRLPEFDPFFSAAAWYRDYAAYCGVSETGDKLFAVVAQAGTHKPLVRAALQSITGTEDESPCHLPVWERDPIRVTFTLKDGRKLVFNVHGHAAAAAAGAPQEEDEAK